MYIPFQVSLFGTSQITTSYLHHVLPHVDQLFLRAPATGRQEYLLDAMEKDLTKESPVIVFSNKSSTANFVKHFLNGRST